MQTPVNDIESLIPQRPPMVMVGGLIYANELGCRTNFTIPAANLFVQNGQFSEAGLVENIAQTAAARMGYLCRQAERAVPLGYIGAVQNLEIRRLPKINEEIETEIIIKNQIFEVTLVSGAVFSGNEQLASCDLKIFLSSTINS